MAKMKQFMEKQIYEGKWVEVETYHGTFCIPGALLADGGGIGIPVYWDGKLIDEDAGSRLDQGIFRSLVLYYEIYVPASAKDIISFEVKRGFGARLSAPGYLDSTEWTVFGTVEQALEYLEELQGD